MASSKCGNETGITEGEEFFCVTFFLFLFKVWVACGLRECMVSVPECPVTSASTADAPGWQQRQAGNNAHGSSGGRACSRAAVFQCGDGRRAEHPRSLKEGCSTTARRAHAPHEAPSLALEGPPPCWRNGIKIPGSYTIIVRSHSEM